jgi:2-phosphosulfolactate phosphatase
VIQLVKENLDISCAASKMAESLFNEAGNDAFDFMRTKNASHYQRLMGFGLEKDIRHCLQKDTAPVLPVYRDGKLVKGRI